jgi:hypothetical protein
VGCPDAEGDAPLVGACPHAGVLRRGGGRGGSGRHGAFRWGWDGSTVSLVGDGKRKRACRKTTGSNIGSGVGGPCQIASGAALLPKTSERMNSTRKMKNSTLATTYESPAMPVKPSAPARSAISRKTIENLSMICLRIECGCWESCKVMGTAAGPDSSPVAAGWAGSAIVSGVRNLGDSRPLSSKSGTPPNTPPRHLSTASS